MLQDPFHVAFGRKRRKITVIALYSVAIIHVPFDDSRTVACLFLHQGYGFVERKRREGEKEAGAMKREEDERGVGGRAGGRAGGGESPHEPAAFVFRAGGKRVSPIAVPHVLLVLCVVVSQIGLD